MKSIQILYLRFAEGSPSNGVDMILTTATIELPPNDARTKKTTLSARVDRFVHKMRQVGT